MSSRLALSALCLLVVAVAAAPLGATTIRTNSGFTTNSLSRNDDGSTGLVNMGLNANFFGTTYTQLYVNNNGNVTFDAAMSTYTPFDLTSTGRVIIAPFFADVDTRATGSDVVTYGTDTVGGRSAFGVNWDGVNGVGYYSYGVDKLNKFQLVIIDRADVGAGDFDFEFNYDQIEWETGDASGGSGGLGGNSARAGYSNGVDTSYEIDGSAVNGAFLDTNGTTGLIYTSNVNTPGRWVFQVRNGVVEPVVIPEPLTMAGLGLGISAMGLYVRKRRQA